MDVERLHLRIDRLVGGRHAEYRISEELRADPKIRKAFVAITGLLVIEFTLGITVLAVPVMLNMRDVPSIVWMRLLVVLAMTTTLFYFAWRAQRGYYWAYSRLRLFSKIFPVVALVTASVPGLYPLWMVSEQIVFSLVMLGIAEYLSTDHMRLAYVKPPKTPKVPRVLSR